MTFERLEVKEFLGGFGMYTVKEIAELLDLTSHTVRYYSDKGLVPNEQRDKNNNRLFDDESINWLTGVKYLKQCGMSVEDIKTYVDLCLATLPFKNVMKLF